MKIYFSTFITGIQEIIKEFLERRGAKIKLLLDGLVVYESNYSEREIRNFHIFNNTYLLLRSFKNLTPNVQSLEKILSIINHDNNLLRRISANLPPRRRNFKIVCSFENRMVSVNRRLLKNFESILFRVRGLRLNIKKPNLEFWVLIRREGYGFFGIRLTYPFAGERKREKGELRKEIAYIMSLISKPTPKDVVIDPFAGYGSIPIERALSFPFKKIIAIDKDKNLVSRLKRKVNELRKNITVIHGDALSLSKINTDSIDKIISDPPWGEYKAIAKPEKFFEKMLWEFNRILKQDGIIVLLVGAKEIFEDVLRNKFTNVFFLKKKYNILVSGKKASIYKLVKNHVKGL